MDDGGLRGAMVKPAPPDHPRPAWLACKMVFYAVSFLAFILAALPYAFNYLGRLAYPASLQALLRPELSQQVFGVAIFVVGLIGYLVSSLWLVIVGKGPFVEFDPPKEFVATGPYRWTRNPVAAMLLLTVLGEAVFFGSPGIFTLFILGIPLAQLQVVCIEEPRLRTRFGESYVEYCRTVPRWFPRRPSRKSADRR
jgi:protein-S-isoprenylcysteine O-methyltransferase Ste14